MRRFLSLGLGIKILILWVVSVQIIITFLCSLPRDSGFRRVIFLSPARGDSSGNSTSIQNHTDPFYDQLQDQFDDEWQWWKFRTTHHRLLRTPLQILFMSLQVKPITPTMSRNKSNERNWHCQVEGQCSIAQFLGQPGARLMNISFILKYFKSYWDVRKHMISKDTEHPKTTRIKKEINNRLTKSPRYRGFVLMLQHLRFFPLASSSSGWFFWRFLPESLHHN